MLLEIDRQGARAVKSIFPDIVSVVQENAQELVKRGKDSKEVIERRLAEAREDLKHVHQADYVIINEDFSVALLDLQSVVRALRVTAVRQLKLHANLIS